MDKQQTNTQVLENKYTSYNYKSQLSTDEYGTIRNKQIVK